MNWYKDIQKEKKNPRTMKALYPAWIKKGETEQVYVDDERERLLMQAEKQCEKTGNVAYLAVCMNFFLALRVGEIVALKTTDFSVDSVQITRQEVKEYYMDADDRRHRLGYGVSPYPKSPAGNRILYLSKRARKYYHKILEHNRCNGLEGEYLFMVETGKDFTIMP